MRVRHNWLAMGSTMAFGLTLPIATQASQPSFKGGLSASLIHRQPAELSLLSSFSCSAADLLRPGIGAGHRKLALSSTAISAQVTDTGLASDRAIYPRVGIGYAGAGYEGSDAFGYLNGFLPLRQDRGRNLTFLEGRVLLDNDANLGSNVILGHRIYNEKDNRIYGGYIAYDTRDSGHKFFQQIGLGFESLGERWDLRTNFYIPVGDTRQQVDVDIADTGLLVTDTRFSGHFLWVDTFRQRSERRVHEAAVFSFDLEAGGKLAQLGEWGNLWIYGGPYYYSPPGGRNVLGWRTRLVARLSRFLKFSAGVQTDALFGTNVLFRIGSDFPSHRSRRTKKDDKTILARMGEWVWRDRSIAIDRQVNESFFQEALTFPVRNPATQDPWFFNHVTLGVSGGDGSFETPFGTVQNGLNNTRSDGNDIVYVAQGTDRVIPPFTIPENVQVLSRGPVQTIPVVTTLQSERLPLRTVMLTSPLQLPFSNSGNFPRIEGVQAGASVILGNDSVLSGFTITPTNRHVGVLGRNVRNVTIRDNRISRALHGILLDNVTGLATISNNQIETTLSDGARVQLSIPGSLTLFMTDNTVAQAGNNGIKVETANSATLMAIITGNTSSDSGDDGIDINSYDSSTLLAIVSGNTAIGASDDGIDFDQLGMSQLATIVSGNTVTNSNDNGLEFEATDMSQLTAIISGNTITNSGDDGIDVEFRDASQLTAIISGNTITNSGDDGIDVDLYDTTQGIAIVVGNTINRASNHGLAFNTYNTSQLTATVSGNTISNVGGNRLYFSAVPGSSLTMATLSSSDLSLIKNADFGPSIMAAQQLVAGFSDNEILLPETLLLWATPQQFP